MHGEATFVSTMWKQIVNIPELYLSYNVDITAQKFLHDGCRDGFAVNI